MVSEPSFEARTAVNPLLMGYGLAKSSRKGRKSQLKKASTSVYHLIGSLFIFFLLLALPGDGRRKKDDVCVTKGCSTRAWLTLADHVKKQLRTLARAV